MIMTHFKHALGLSLTLALAAFAPAASFAQSANEMTPEEIEALFKKQKTRGLVLVPQAAANDAASSAAVAAPVAPVASATVTTTAPVAVAPSATTPTATTAPTYVAVQKEDQVNVQISFDFDSAALRADQKPKLATLCQVMKSVDVSVFQIVGHTDSSGSAAYNQKLSLLRAQEVKRHMVSDCGIAENRLQAVGAGESAPYNANDPRADENRRVEFQALG